VEDHPYAYKNFEGTIPKGNYGAGEVIVRDRGTYRSAEGDGEEILLKNLHKGALGIVLRGKNSRRIFPRAAQAPASMASHQEERRLCQHPRHHAQ